MKSSTERRNSGEHRKDVYADERAAQELRTALEQMGAELRGAVTAMRRSLYLGQGALRLALFDKVFHLGALVAGTAVAVTMTVLASVLAVSGVRRGLSTWTDGAWWVDLVVALGVLGATAASAWAYSRWMHRSIVSATRAKVSRAGSEEVEPTRPS